MAHPRLIPLTVASALFMENMDGSVISTSLPAIAADLGVDPVALKLAFTAYLISLAAFIPLSAWLTEKFGARQVFRAAIAVFSLASLGCGFAWSLESLVAARAMQGMGGAMMIPVGRAVMLRAIPKDRIVNAMMYLTVPALIGPLIGPLLGGFLTAYLDWRWIFWINLPVGLLGIALASAYMPDIRDEDVRRFDFLEYALAALGLCALVSGFTLFSGDLMSKSAALALAAAGAALLACYMFRARRNPEPLVDLRLLRVVTLRSSLLGGVFFRISAGAIGFMLPLMFQLGFGLDAFQSGSLTFVGAIGAIGMKFAAGPILKAFGFRKVLIGNALISAAFFIAYGSMTAATPHWLIIAILLVGFFFRSLQFTSLGAMAYSDIEGRDTAQASTLFSVVQQFAISSGVALAAMILDWSRGAGALSTKDFALAFFVMAAITAFSALAHLRLPADAGANVSGKILA